MTKFQDALQHVIAQTKFHYRATPWKYREAIRALKVILTAPDVTDQDIYREVQAYCATLPEALNYFRGLIDNTLSIYDHSVNEIDLATIPILEANEAVKGWSDFFSDLRGIVTCIGFNAASKLHIIKVQQGAKLLTFYIRDKDYNFAGNVPLQHDIQVADILLGERQILTEYEALAGNPRSALIQFMQSQDGPSVLSIVEPDTFCPEGELVLQMPSGHLEIISLQGNTLFLGESEAFQHDDLVLFPLAGGVELIEKTIPIRIWHKPWQSVLDNNLERSVILDHKEKGPLSKISVHKEKERPLEVLDYKEAEHLSEVSEHKERGASLEMREYKERKRLPEFHEYKGERSFVSVLDSKDKESFSKVKGVTISSINGKKKIIIALHGIFDHKGAYHEMAKTLLANSDPMESLLVIAADWPTYGTSPDRDQPMPTFAVMKQYLMALLDHVATTYPGSEIYLLGESLGATMIFICSEELAEFQEHNSCLGGTIAISPAIHNPATYILFKQRFCGFSAPYSVFKNIWFNDPEVNHNGAVGRIWATIPYLSEAYNQVQHWSDKIPCAVLLASHDSVVAKDPAVSLYRLLNNDQMAFYAFPSRHLLLRSQSEGDKYIDKHIIYRDIGAIVGFMSQEQFSRTTVLPYSGADSAETMDWFHQLYRQTCCCGGVSGYLKSWPSTPLAYLPLYKFIKPPLPSLKKENLIPPTSLLGIFPDEEHAINFIEHPVVGDGDCGFHVLGITRHRLVEILLPLQDSAEAREALAPEIRFALLSNDIPDSIKPVLWRETKQNYQAIWEDLELVMSKVKSHIDEPYPGEFGLNERVGWLKEKTESDEEQIELTVALERFGKVNEEINTLCTSTETFIRYVNLYGIPKMMWLGYQAALLWAQASDISLMIWRKNADAADMLTLMHSYQAPEEKNIIHMLHTSGFTHFNLLEVAQARNLLEEKEQIINWNHKVKDWSLDHTLYELFVEQTKATPDNPAVISSIRSFTYVEILEHANRVAHALKAREVEPNQLVGILMNKGWEQVVACFGILGSGAAFLPMDADWPEERIKQVMTKGNVRLVLSQQDVLVSLADSDLLSEVTSFAIDDEDTWAPYPKTALERQQNPNDIAYVIFTSGSTGQPKGVIISHQSAINTIFDINERFGVTEHDRVLALSNLSFDLAIYDLFGLLSVGGAMVLPDADKLKEPGHWLNLLTTSYVTLWNTVPMFMQMLVESLDHIPEIQRPALEDTLRVVLLSGDWIPLELPEHTWKYFTKSKFISLGGATEGSIWSIIHPVEEVNPSWKSIPYGVPMSNQHMYVLDEKLSHCPIGITGEIHIGGQGVALGYWGDAERTEASFIIHPETEERLYKTGDLGVWDEVGYIKFIGRKDTQVKISGYRVELGEIEAVLSQYPIVKQCAVISYDHGKQKQLAAYVVPDYDEAAPLKRKEEHITGWGEVYDGIYRIGKEHFDLDFNIAGWQSSYTGELIAEPEMQEWVGQTAHRILGLKPKHVLEIGCGTGLLVSRIAPHCQTYIATDISGTAIEAIQELVKSKEGLLDHVTTFHRPANDFSGWDELRVDTIIINSVIQCFSGVEYLLDVINNAARLLSPSGQLFIGDVRHLGLLEAHHASVQLYKTTTALSRYEFLNQVQTQIAREEELLVDPTFFHALRHHVPRLCHAQIQMKSGRYDNELNKFRYDAILFVSDEPILTLAPRWQEWSFADNLPTLNEKLQEWIKSTDVDGVVPNVLGIKGIPNARLLREGSTLDWMHEEEECKVSSTEELKLYNSAPRVMDQDIDPYEIVQLGESLELRVELRWNYRDSIKFFDAIFVTKPPSLITYPAIACPDSCCEVVDWQKYVNYPLLSKLQQSLIPRLIEYLGEKLPHYMIPTTFTLLPYLPLSSNGKVDRKALPAPRHMTGKMENLEMAHTVTEETLIRLFGHALELDRMSIRDSFFALGGNSLLAVHLIAEINRQFKTAHPVSLLFTHQTVEGLAKILHDSDISGYRPLLTFNADGKRPPLFFVHSGRGGAEAYVTLARNFDENQPIHIIESYNLYNEPPFLDTIVGMATRYLSYVQDVQPSGPYYLGGWSQGGIVAYEMAQMLKLQSQDVRVIYFLDTFLYTPFECSQFRSGADNFLARDPFYRELPESFREHAKAADKVQTLAMLDYRPLPYNGDVILLKATEDWSFLDNPAFKWNWAVKKFMHHAFSKKHNGWSKLISNLRVHPVPGHHQSIMEGDNAATMVRIIQEDLVIKQSIVRGGDYVIVVHAEEKNIGGEGILKLQEEYHKLSPIYPFYNKYYKYGLDDMLLLRLKDANLHGIATLPAFKLNIHTLQTTLPQITRKLGEGFNEVIVPCNIEGKHWIGFLFQKTVDSLKVLYLDSEHGKLAVSFKNQFIEYFQEEYQEVLMIEEAVERQKYNNCGPEVIENFIKYLGKERLPQGEAVYYHSQLLEQSLLNFDVRRLLGDNEDIPLEKMHAGTELSLQITNQAGSDNTDSIPNMGFDFIKRLNNYVEHYLKKLFLPNEFYEMQQLANKHKVDIKIVDEVTLKQAYKKIALKTHPDKYPDTAEDFMKAKQLLEQKESPLPTELYTPIMEKLQKVNIVVEAVDTTIDSIRAFKDPSLENVLKVGTGCVYLASMYTGKTGVMLPIAAAGSAYQVYQGDYWEAAASMTKAIGFTLMFSTIYTTAPAVAVVLSTGFTGYATYSMLNNGYKLYNEFLEPSPINDINLNQDTFDF